MEAQMEALISRLAMPLPEDTKTQTIREHLHYACWSELDRLSASLPSINPLAIVLYTLPGNWAESFIPHHYHSLY